MSAKTVLICGASVAGPALAYWLDRYGLQVTVVERAAALRPGGQAVDFKGRTQLTVLERMGVREEIFRRQTGRADVRFLDASGRQRAVMTGEFLGGDVEILRGDLAAVFYERTAGREILGGLGLRLHPDKTRTVDLREGREGLDFLGCHFRARMSGRIWEQRRIRRYYLHRWPSQRAMKRLREKIRDRTGRSRAGQDIREVIAVLNPVLRGWGNYFRTGNAAKKFRQADCYVVERLRGLMIKKRGRNLHAGQADTWTEDWFNGHGLHRLRGTVRYPRAA